MTTPSPAPLLVLVAMPEEAAPLEARLQARAGRTDDHREAVEAFLAKRPPVFTGH